MMIHHSVSHRTVDGKSKDTNAAQLGDGKFSNSVLDMGKGKLRPGNMY